MVLWQDVLIVEGLTRFDAHEGVVPVALGGHVQTVHVQVRRGLQAVGHRHPEGVPAPDPQGGSGQRGVEGLHARLTRPDPHSGGGGLQGQVQDPVPAGQHLGLQQRPIAAEGLTAAAAGPPQPARAHGRGTGPDRTQGQQLPSRQRAHRSPSSRVRNRSLYSSVLISPRA